MMSKYGYFEEMRNVYIIATTVKKFRINGSRREKQVFLVNVIRSSLVRCKYYRPKNTSGGNS